jgi:hypothetical protein
MISRRARPLGVFLCDLLPISTTVVMAEPLLFTSLTLRSVVLRNRIVISPMCQYSASDGLANDWHLVHLGRFALGGAGLVFVEATAIQREGRITHGDMGLWSDAHIAPLKRIVAFMKAHGAVPAIQLAHAGRKASMQRPWHGNGPLDASDRARGEETWPIVAPCSLPLDEGWLMPAALEAGDLAALREDWRRCRTPRARGGLRGHGNPWRSRLPSPHLPFAARQSPQRRLWRRSCRAHALSAGDRRNAARGMAPGPAGLLPRLLGGWHRRRLDARGHGGAGARA